MSLTVTLLLSYREPSVLPQQVPSWIWAGIRPQWTWEAARTPGCGRICRPRFHAASASGWRWHTNLVNGHQCGPTLLGGWWDGVFWICWWVVQSIVFPGCCFDDGVWISGWCLLMLESCLLCGCGCSSALCSFLLNKLTLIFASHQCCILLQKEVCWCCSFLYKSQDVLNCAKFSTFIVQSSFGSGSVLWVWEPEAVYVLSFHQESRFESCCGLSFTALVCVACGLNVTALLCLCGLWFEFYCLGTFVYCLGTFVWLVVWVLLPWYHTCQPIQFTCIK